MESTAEMREALRTVNAEDARQRRGSGYISKQDVQNLEVVLEHHDHVLTILTRIQEIANPLPVE